MGLVVGGPPSSFEVRAGRFAGRLYAVATIATPLWVVLTGGRFDVRMIAFVIGCAAAAVIPQLPVWDDRGPLLVRTTLVVASVVQVVFLALWLDNPLMMIFPAISATYAGSVIDRRWIAGHLVPPAVGLFVLTAADEGLLAGLGHALFFLVLWITIGEIPLWLRSVIDETARALRDAEAEGARRDGDRVVAEADRARQVTDELSRRRELAATLRVLADEASSASHRVEDQSRSIATQVTRLAGSSQEIADTAREADGTVRRIAVATRESRELVNQLGSAGQQIAGIAEVITDLSEQTNLLALNATIESARAGEAGKGFAVVATEVKNLAQRTAQSAAGIGAVINQVQERLVASTDSMAVIADMVTKLEGDQSVLTAAVTDQTNVLGDISAASSAEADGVVEIGRVIRLLDDSARHLDQGGD